MDSSEENLISFKKTSLRENDKVAIISRNSLDYAAAINICWKLNLTAVPLNINYPQKKIDGILTDIDCRYVLAGDDISIGFKHQKVFLIDELIKKKNDLVLKVFNEKLFLNLGNDSNIIYSSGSSDLPKAVLHNLSNHYYSALGANINMPLDKDSVYLVVLPFYHISGFSIIMRALISGSSIAVKPPGLSIADSAKRVNATHISLVPSQLYKMMGAKKDIDVLKKMKAILLGGSDVSDSLIEECFYHKLNIIRTYGLTELASQVSATSDNDSLKHLKTSGRVLRFRQLMIGKDDEVFVKGKTLFKGYLKDKKLRLTEPGWFATKDRGFIDSDGYLNITGRKDSMFTVKGANVYPEELEKQINSFEAVQESLVVNIEQPSKDNMIAAFIKAFGKVDKDKLKQFLGSRLEKQKIPKYFFDWPQEDGLKPNRKRFKEIAQHILDKKSP